MSSLYAVHLARLMKSDILLYLLYYELLVIAVLKLHAIVHVHGYLITCI